MVARHDRNPPPARRRRDAERITLTLYDEHRHLHRIELANPVLSAARWTQWKGEAKDGHDIRRGSRPARDPSARRAAADDKGQAGERPFAQCPDDDEPRLVELRRTRRRSPSGDPVGLLHERDCQPFLLGRQRSCGEIGRIDSAARAVTEHQRRPGSGRRAHAGAR